MEVYRNTITTGGRALAEANKKYSQWLDSIEGDLSAKAVDIISDTEYNALYECFGFLETAEEINAYVEEFYTD